jgi:hypothetical protein
MNRRVSIPSDAPPGVVLDRLRELAAHLPPSGRLHPGHVTGVQIAVQATRFSLQCERKYRDYFGPVCTGRAIPRQTGSMVDLAIRRNRASLTVFVAAIPLLAYYSATGHFGLGSLVILVLLLGLILAWTFLMGLLNTNKHEAEVDALVALVRKAAGPAPDDQAVA